MFCYRACEGCYIYTLGIVEATRIKETDFSCENTRQDLCVSQISYRNKSQAASKWPKMPETLNYNNLRHCNPKLPYCIYALKHDVFIAASSLDHHDEGLFDYVKTSNQQIFSNYDALLRNTEEKAKKLTIQLDLRSVVPKRKSDKMVINLKDKINATFLKH